MNPEVEQWLDEYIEDKPRSGGMKQWIIVYTAVVLAQITVHEIYMFLATLQPHVIIG